MNSSFIVRRVPLTVFQGFRLGLMSCLLAVTLGCSDEPNTALQPPPAPPSPPSPPSPPGPGLTVSVTHSSFLGGSARDDIRGVQVDAQGNIYVVGSTWSTNFPVTSGSFDTNCAAGGNADVFVAKLSPDGRAVIWATCLGGPDTDFGIDLRVDAAGFVYVVGQAGSGFPVTTNALQRTYMGGGHDGFVCKIRPDGASLEFCTYFGSIDSDLVRSMDIDAAGNVYIAPFSETDTYPRSWFQNAWQPTRGGQRDLIVTKISADGSQVLWATYLGGSGDEIGESIAIGPNGTVYVATYTPSTNLPTPGGFQSQAGGGTDVYLARLTAGGDGLVFGTYIGGSGDETLESHQIAVDGTGNVTVTGFTTSSDLTTTSGVLQPSFGGNQDVFITKVSGTGGLLASTYLGGVGRDGAEAVQVGPTYILVAGETGSPDFSLANPYQATFGGGEDAFVSLLSPNLDSLYYSTFVGGTQFEVFRAAIVTSQGRVVLAGNSESSDWPTLAPLQSGNAGDVDAVFFEMDVR